MYEVGHKNGDGPFLHAQQCLKGCSDGVLDGGVRAKGDFAIARTEKEHHYSFTSRDLS